MVRANELPVKLRANAFISYAPKATRLLLLLAQFVLTTRH